MSEEAQFFQEAFNGPYDNYDIIMSSMKLSIGVSSLNDFAEVEREMLKDALKVGLAEYYLCIPYEVKITRVLRGFNGNKISVPFSNILEQLPASYQDKAYVLGITRMNTASSISSVNALSPELYLLGTQITNPINYSDPLGIAAVSTRESESVGRVSYNYDPIAKKVDFITPLMQGQLHVWFGVGFYSPEYIRPDSIDLLCAIIAKYFLSAVITARSSVSVTADYTISTEFLRNKLEEIKAWLEQNLDGFRPISLVWS